MSKAYWVGLIGSVAIRALGPTWRVRVQGDFDGPRGDRIYALFHGQMLLPASRFRDAGAVVLVSRHGDGEMIAQALERLGYRTVRGSSTRGGGAAAREMMERYGDVPWVVTPDGPKGPRGSVKAGLMRLAGDSGRPIQPVAGACSRAVTFSSWDRFTLPWPLARIVLHFGPLFTVPADADPEGREQLARGLEKQMAAADEEAARSLHRW